MHKNISVVDLSIQDDVSTIVDIFDVQSKNHIPIGICDSSGELKLAKLNKWWKGRSIPASRQGLTEALDILNLSVPDELILKCYGLSLSDQYWVRPKDTGISWESINFFDNDFSDDVGDALFGKVNSSEEFSLMSPDNTSDGLLKKKWKIIDGKRYLIKSGSNPFFQEPLNEFFATKLQEELEYMPFVKYSLSSENDIPYSLCENFITRDTELVNAIHINEAYAKKNDISAYMHFLNCCESFGLKNAREQVDYMLVIDFLIANSDRHFRNFGAIRDANTLEWISMAPVFDCGTSMWHNQISSNIKPVKLDESKPFKKNHYLQIELVKSLDWVDFNKLKIMSDICNEIYQQSLYIDDTRRSQLCYGIECRINLLEKVVLGKQRKRFIRN